jgi:hypothetical protein
MGTPKKTEAASCDAIERCKEVYLTKVQALTAAVSGLLMIIGGYGVMVAKATNYENRLVELESDTCNIRQVRTDIRLAINKSDTTIQLLKELKK